MRFALIILEGNGRGRRYRFESGASFGRDAANDVVLNQAAVSRVHARIERDGEGWALVDRGSANGTLLNGTAVAGRSQLRHGDRIEVGKAIFEFREARGRARLRTRWRKLRAPARATAIAAAVLLGGTAVGRGAHLAEAHPVEEGDGRAGAPAVEAPIGPPAAGSVERAQAAYQRGLRKLRERRIAPRNLYDAWAAFLAARGELERAGGGEGVVAGVQRAIADAERDLARECRRLLFSASRFDRYGEEEKAQRAWREILLHFPGDDPAGCRRKAKENLVSPQPDDGDG